MNKAKRWQVFVISCALILTVVNILPTIFYYTKPLHEPINEKHAQQIATRIAKRVNSLESDAINWVQSYAKTLQIKPNKIDFDTKSPDQIQVSFTNESDAKLFYNHAQKAGSLIPFIPSQLAVCQKDESKSVFLRRQIPIHFEDQEVHSVFKFSKKRNSDGSVTPVYRDLILDRLGQIAKTCAGVSENARYLETIINNPNNPQAQQLIFHIADAIQNYQHALGADSSACKRLFNTFTQGPFSSGFEAIKQLEGSFEQTLDRIKLERIAASSNESDHYRLDSLTSKEKCLANALQTLKQQRANFAAGPAPLTEKAIEVKLAALKDTSSVFQFGKNHPLFESITVDWAHDKFIFNIHPDVAQNKQLLFGEIAKISNETKETIKPNGDHFEIELSTLSGSDSFLILDLGQLAQKRSQTVKDILEQQWTPNHIDFKRDHFPIWDLKTYDQLPIEQRQFGLLVYAPADQNSAPMAGFKRSSIYIIAKGADQILKKHQTNPESTQAQMFFEDFQALQKTLADQGFHVYPGTTYPLSSNFSKDYIFEAEDYYLPLVKATREDFKVLGSRKFALLELKDVEQRILTENRIDTEIHEELLKAHDDYHAARYSRDPSRHFELAKPKKSGFFHNILLSATKYFRGDERKILRWGLDLSGGKTVRIELRDQNNQIVSDEAQIDQGINELFTRVNKMGVSEVNIRREGTHILLDFPGSQNYSANDLVKASSMYFHVVNEKFSPYNTDLYNATHQFLQGVWNEAIVTGKRDIESINLIAHQHLYGDSVDHPTPRYDAAKTLLENGLKLANPLTHSRSSSFDDSLSKITILRGNDESDRHGQTHPLMIVFNNFALEGSDLSDVRAGYDPSKGNYLSYSVADSNARNNLRAWTRAYCKDTVANTPLASCSQGRGWRMAVILNGSAVNAATLESELSDNAMITGSFTQREINKLEADLKAGSLSYAPRILSEQNISPELGQKDRTQGIIATIIALIAVIAMMIGYYRFAGIVASGAVIFNLLMMWAALQNIQATLSLAGIAGVILTLGMAVDANVLVFERVREEFEISGSLSSALATGYRKASSAIFDSNITTLIAAIILLNFDSGPIKAFAIMLIIGIVSSMFTALFMTRIFFQRWVRKTQATSLKMASFMKNRSFNFLKNAKIAISISLITALVGGFLLFKNQNSILGMDFTGGYALNIEFKHDAEKNYRQLTEAALLKAGLKSKDFQIRQLTMPNALRICLSASMENKGQPFYNLPFADDHQTVKYPFENNPRLKWVVDALTASDIQITTESLATLDKHWNAISGQISDAMRKSASLGVALALLCILIYITIRFEFKYAISATLSLAHDVILSLAAMAIFHTLGLPIQIDLTTVAALMTIVGYSLNDTIIVFDRIREDVRLLGSKMRFSEIVNRAVNVTLSRTLMTSATTLIVLIALVLFGGSSILGFALVMTVGVIIGTFSSLFIATTLMLAFHKREQKLFNPAATNT